MSQEPRFYTFEGPLVPPVVGHYCHAVVLPGGAIHLSGQKGWDNTGSLVHGGPEAELVQCLDNVERLLTRLELTWHHVTRVMVYLSDERFYPAFDRIYAARLGDARPVRAVLPGLALRGDAAIELVVEAWRAPR